MLSLYLFRPSRRPGGAWRCGAVACLLLVPNAPYVLTDVIHRPPSVRRGPSDPAVLLVVFPVYGALFAIGFGAYCDALRRFTGFVIGAGWVRSPWAVELPVHAVSALAISVGRIHRFISWGPCPATPRCPRPCPRRDTRPLPIAGIAVMFVCLTLSQALIRTLILGRLAQLRGATG